MPFTTKKRTGTFSLSSPGFVIDMLFVVANVVTPFPPGKSSSTILMSYVPPTSFVQNVSPVQDGVVLEPFL